MSGEAGSGTVFFSHCPLHCIYCQNRAIANGDAGLDIGIDRLAHIFLELQDQGALNINLVTPTPRFCASARLEGSFSPAASVPAMMSSRIRS